MKIASEKIHPDTMAFLRDCVLERILDKRRKSTAKAQGLILSESAAGRRIRKNAKNECVFGDTFSFSWLGIVVAGVSILFSSESLFLKKSMMSLSPQSVVFVRLLTIKGTQSLSRGIHIFFPTARNSSLFFVSK